MERIGQDLSQDLSQDRRNRTCGSAPNTRQAGPELTESDRLDRFQ